MTLDSHLHWHAEREQIRELLGTSADSDLAAAVCELRRRLEALEAENSRLRAHLSTSRHLSSEAIHGTMSLVAPAQAPAAPEVPVGAPPIDVLGLLGCPECRTHLGADGFVVDACASVAHESGRRVSQVLREYLELFHGRQHRVGSRPAGPEP